MSIDESNELKRLIQSYTEALMKEYTLSDHSTVSNSTSETSLSSSDSPPSPITVPDNVDIGQLQVRVSTENQAVPIEGAVVTISHNSPNGEIVDSVSITDESGLTVLLSLPAKDRNLSLSPKNAEPYTLYTVEVVADGYYVKRFTDLPIYGGVTAVQNIAMLPLPEQSDSDIPLVYPESPPFLT